MKLQANAALSWSGRRLLVERVLVEGWTDAEGGGRGRRRQRALRTEWTRRLAEDETKKPCKSWEAL